jgi:hypothetical protein
LDHEAWDDPVECRSLVPQRLAGLGYSFLPCISNNRKRICTVSLNSE